MTDNTTAYRDMAAAAAKVLAGWHDASAGTWPDCWWQSANALEALIDYEEEWHTGEYAHVISLTFERAQSQAAGFLNEYYDDEGWWAIAWIKAYDLTGEGRYVDMARRLFLDMVKGWDDTHGGGVWWTKEKTYKNAIPNELFLVLATRLYHRLGDPSYLEWAERAWNWFRSSGMINNEGLVNDGLDDEGRNNGGITWTYNQGVILGGMVELHRATGDEEIVQLAQLIADATTSKLVYEGGILREPCEDPALGRTCDGDQELFKGIFARYLGQLYGLVERPVYAEFIQKNADSLWQNGRGEGDEFGLRWVGPFDGSSVQRQTSALDLFNAAAGCGTAR